MQFSKDDIRLLTEVSSVKFDVGDVGEAYAFCERLAKKHYENFPVGSMLVKKEDRKYFYAVYAFARLGDDIGDEHDLEAEERVVLLERLAGSAKHYYKNPSPGNPILSALSDTLHKKRIKIETPLRLLKAFQMDAEFRQPITYHDLEHYCGFSANPVGELVLAISGELNKENLALSNSLCTGLQLLNFWQDLSRDLPGRIYIPSDTLSNYSISGESLLNGDYKLKNDNFVGMIDELLALTRRYLEKGKQITEKVRSRRLRLELTAIYQVATMVLRKCEELGPQLMEQRPTVKKNEYWRIAHKLIPALF